ncbi:hypothetical protein THIOKS12940010 [Thiocapsa sp. KS1]|nr:hypothetical protein THIOKS12940010 [Thiocapsa sp. KS1]
MGYLNRARQFIRGSPPTDTDHSLARIGAARFKDSNTLMILNCVFAETTGGRQAPNTRYTALTDSGRSSNVRTGFSRPSQRHSR